MTSSFPPPSTPSLSTVIDELARLRTRVASEDRTAILDSIRRMDHELRILDRRARAVAQLAQSALDSHDEALTEAALRDAAQLCVERFSLTPPPPR